MSDTGTNFVNYVKYIVGLAMEVADPPICIEQNIFPKGGPDGGDGGRGGHIILHANKNYWTLIHFKI